MHSIRISNLRPRQMVRPDSVISSFSMRSLKMLGEAYKYLANVDPVVDDDADITQSLAKIIEAGAALNISADKIRGYGEKDLAA